MCGFVLNELRERPRCRLQAQETAQVEGKEKLE
jgi:hypothetical protein